MSGLSLREQIAELIGEERYKDPFVTEQDREFGRGLADHLLRLVVEVVEGTPRLKDAHKYLNPADAAYAERAAIVALLGGQETPHSNTTSPESEI